MEAVFNARLVEWVLALIGVVFPVSDGEIEAVFNARLVWWVFALIGVVFPVSDG